MKLLKCSSLLLLVLTISALLSSCKKDKGRDHVTLPGTWKLTETWGTIGDGTGNWAKAPESPEVKLIITQNGDVSGDVLKEVQKITVIDETHLQVQLKESAGAGQPVTFMYTLSGNTLEIQGVCWEGCRYRFIKVK